MRARSKPKGPTEAEKMRVLVAYKNGDDWKLVAKHNGVSVTTARRVVNNGHVNQKPRGGARMGRSKVTPAIREALERYVDQNCSYTLTAMKEFVANDFPGTELSLQTIQSCFRRRRDQTFKCSVLCRPNKALFCHRLERGSIKMAQNAAFVEEIYQAVTSSATWDANFQGKKVVIVLDNAPAHSQTEQRVQPHEDVVLLRLGPEFNSILESRMRLLQEAARESLPCITQSLVIREAMFCQRNVEKALRFEDMSYGM
ncbi:hypothetical protein H257_05574 [Aphanomyces astaci]|uniref:Tc1-like transposase DDE domain-containing protein n=1 Tax=Aphanomyces astaci TaxID=112090 RepID=W4GQS3_APHAT|nr:hypothetical protein H257_05574 [Aphanomyces astaci]ETV82055.1 hypothetical protein H257_05574 [Aphanomyces astaci]|eukprot:XP_009828792.1 hypothetical protein H257_05574 [Aphanomyces astaci]